MNEDRELLEFAAKAAGIVGKWEKDWSYIQDHYYFYVPYDNHGVLSGFRWNPLTDDGDAFRLAVELRIKFRYNAALGQALAWIGADEIEVRENIEDCQRSECIAARRAIVRAAAEIGKAL